MAKRARKQQPQTDNRPGPGWFHRLEMADIFNCSPTHYDRHFGKFADDNSTRFVHKKKYYLARNVIDNWVKHNERELRHKTIKDDDGDTIILDGGDGDPHKAELLKYKAKNERLKFLRESRAYLPAQFFNQVLLKMSDGLRGQIENMQRQFGNEIGEAMNQAVEKIEAQVMSVIAAADERVVVDDEEDSV